MVHALDIRDENINPIARFDSVASILNLIVPLLITGAGIVFFVMFLYGGVTIITAGGNQEQFQKAQKIFQNSIIGLVIVIVSFLIVKVTELIFGIRIFAPQL